MTKKQYFLNFFIHVWGTTLHKMWVMYFVVGFILRLLWKRPTHNIENTEFTKVLNGEFYNLLPEFNLIDSVRMFCSCCFTVKLLWRGITHDVSKYHPLEVKEFMKVIHLLPNLKYGSDDYKQCLQTIQPALNHHYNKNKHHPEYWRTHSENGELISNMSLLDIVEMFIDWRASVKRHKSGNILRSIDINEERYKIPSELCSIFKNTIK